MAGLMSVVLLTLVSGVGLAAQEGLDPRDLVVLGEPVGPPLSGPGLAAATLEVTSLMRCPVCQGLSVADSHTPSAMAMQVKAEALLEAGYSEEQVLTYFESSYGEFIRLAPRPEGFNLVVWYLPLVGLLIGGLVIWFRLRRQGAAGQVVNDDGDDELAAYREQVRREVEQ